EKLSGSDIFPKLCEISAEKGYRLFFLGAGEGVAEQAVSNLKKAFSKINVVGAYAPPLGFEKNEKENEKICKMINKLAPDILFVGFGAPKQEKWIHKNLHALNVRVAIAVGAAFDFAAGNIKRAPVFMQKIGLEWFWRFMHEPKRLFKRYFIDDSQFILILIKQFWLKIR
ncbi:MAG: WecB/TagA/CpsF family glycosyltransferase, partial [Deltaproteobacteria bacterium]